MNSTQMKKKTMCRVKDFKIAKKRIGNLRLRKIIIKKKGKHQRRDNLNQNHRKTMKKSKREKRKSQ